MKSFQIGKWRILVYDFFGRDSGQRVWIDFNFGGDFFTLIWWKKGNPVLYRSPDATPPDRDGKQGKFYFGSNKDLYPQG